MKVREFQEDIEEILLAPETIAARVKELGSEISRDYEGKKIIVLGILKGALPFMADLIREIRVPLCYDLMAVSSYGVSTKSSGVVQILKDIEISIEDEEVLIVEDIIDTGLTLRYLVDNIKSRRPAGVKIVTLLDKPDRRQADITPDYNGFVIPDRFVVGYGLDYSEKYRQLPMIAVLKRQVYVEDENSSAI